MTQITEASVLALAPNATFQSLGDGAVILMIDSGQLYTCNETTEAFLNNIDGQRRSSGKRGSVRAMINDFSSGTGPKVIEMRTDGSTRPASS